jgi:hypothetical protein
VITPSRECRWRSFRAHRRGRARPAPPTATSLVVLQRPAVALNADGRVEVVAVGSEQAIWHRWQTAAQGGAADDTTGGHWSQWQPLGRPSGQEILAVLGLAQNADGRLELFTVASDGSVWHRWQQAPGRRTWAAWSSLERPSGRACGGLALAVDRDGHLALFTVASDGAVWHRRQRTAGGWSAWDSLERQVDGFDELAVGGERRRPAGPRRDRTLAQGAYGVVPGGSCRGWLVAVDASAQELHFRRRGIGPTESPTLRRNFDGELVLHLLAAPPVFLWEFRQEEPNGIFPAGNGQGWGPQPPAGDVSVIVETKQLI